MTAPHSPAQTNHHSPAPARDRFIALLRTAVTDGALIKLTLGKHRGADSTLKNLFVRPVTLKNGPQLCFVYRHATRDITKNHPPAEALSLLEKLIGTDFLDAHLFTPSQTAQLGATSDDPASARLSLKKQPPAATAPLSPDSNDTPPPSTAPTPQPDLATVAPSRDTAPAPLPAHDRAREHLIPIHAPWLRALGITNEKSQPREGMAAKFRQINKFSELLRHLALEARLLPSDSAHPSASDPVSQLSTLDSPAPLRIADMASGKGYLTFATAALFGPRAEVLGIEVRPELVALCNRAASETRFSNLTFTAGDIATASLDRIDILIALHACDTATDDALIAGIKAHATLIVVSPCCQKELRPQLSAPAVLADALRHGIFQERHAEFVTDALRAHLLEWAGYKTKVFEFVSTEHTAKNLMISAIKTRPPATADDPLAAKIRDFARFYGIRTHRLATHLGFAL